MKELQEQMNDLIHLPHNQQFLCNELQRVEVEEVLDGSLKLLDSSSSILEAMSQLKESILDLKLAIRRGSHNEGIHNFLVSRRKINKALSKCLVNLKKTEQSCASKQRNNEGSITSITRVLQEAEKISLDTLKSLLSFVMGKKQVSHTRGWSLVNKLVTDALVFSI